MNEHSKEPDIANMSTWEELLEETVNTLSLLYPESARVEGQWIVLSASGYDQAGFLKNKDTIASNLATRNLKRILNRRIEGEPIQYALGSWSFRNLELIVDKRVLIPRPETEVLVEVALSFLSQNQQTDTKIICDLGTGSGAIGLSIAQECNDVEVTLVDHSMDALKVASANLAGLGNHAVKARILQSSWFENFPESMRNSFDLIVSNPPYIAFGEDLPPSVLNFEPSEALFAGEKGTEDIESILISASQWLTTGGALVIEMAPHQTTEMSETAKSEGYSNIKVHKDLAKKPRIVSCIWEE
ncbi:MAG: protein-(glutamine-N5) methyltransferase, release factor-specific [Acidimicrobiaceae bacterium]|jgi:release factor glutamine methyltransferase|nr:protein-(glutamine-N5) methyltransferase, release factor-specific [Acidimicrobiaceae bacterium]|tara:strand:+ start:16285 stop:17187 length:903 start_codon:yes stop_codon:yes gene_type:complete